MSIKCDFCPEYFKSAVTMTKHMKNTHTLPGVAISAVQCTECDLIVILSSNLKTHLKNSHKKFYSRNRPEVDAGDLRVADYPGAKKIFALRIANDSDSGWRALDQQESEEYSACNYWNCKAKVASATVLEKHLEQHEKLEQCKRKFEGNKGGLQPTDVAAQQPTANPALQTVALKTDKAFKLKCDVEECGVEVYSVEAFKEHAEEHGEGITGTFTFLPDETASSKANKRTNSEFPDAKKQRTAK